MSLNSRLSLLSRRAILHNQQQKCWWHKSPTSYRFWDLLNLDNLAVKEKKVDYLVANSSLDNHDPSENLYTFLKDDVVLPIKSFFVNGHIDRKVLLDSSKCSQKFYNEVLNSQAQVGLSLQQYHLSDSETQQKLEKKLEQSEEKLKLNESKQSLAVKETITKSTDAGGCASATLNKARAEGKATCFSKAKSCIGSDSSQYRTIKSHFSTAARLSLQLHDEPSGCGKNEEVGSCGRKSKEADQSVDSCDKSSKCEPMKKKKKKNLYDERCNPCDNKKKNFTVIDGLVQPLLQTALPLNVPIRSIKTSNFLRDKNKKCPNTVSKTKKELEKEREALIKKEHKEIEDCLTARLKKKPADNKKK